MLASHGIVSNVVGAKEYASHFLGGEQGRYALFVDEAEFARARDLLDEVSRQIVDSDGSGAPNYFRRAVFLSFAAIVILPVVFNIGALLNAKKFWDHSDRSIGAKARVGLILLLQLPTVFILFYLWNLVGDISAMFGGGLGVGEDF